MGPGVESLSSNPYCSPSAPFSYHALAFLPTHHFVPLSICLVLSEPLVFSFTTLQATFWLSIIMFVSASGSGEIGERKIMPGVN